MNEDRDLVDFLRQHSPAVPPASPDLAQQILQQVKAVPIKRQHQHFRFWLGPSLVMTGFLAMLATGYIIFVPSQPSPAELANLEDFMKTSWQGAVSENVSDDTWYLLETSAD
jgi:hypothetical protein